MNFEAGKYYRRRDGKKFYLAAILPPNPFNEHSVGLLYGYTEGDREVYPEVRGVDGKRFLIVDYPADLVAEWREPASCRKTVYLYRDVSGGLFVTTCEGGFTLLGKKEITITEGEGMT